MKSVYNFFIRSIVRLFGARKIIDSIDINILMSKIENAKIKNCKAQISIDSEVNFHKEAIVYNLQNNRSKIRINENTHIRGELLCFKYGGKIEIGRNCYIGEGSRIWSGEYVKIGDNVLISHNVNIVDTNAHEIDHLERTERYIDLIHNGPWKDKNDIVSKPIIIEDYAWINFGVTILKGVTIGKGAIIAAGSVVVKNVDSFTMVAGNPAKEIKKI